MPVSVHDIMTHDLTIFSKSASVVSARKTMEESKFDVAPIDVGGYIGKFAVLSDLKDSKDTNKIIQEGKSLNEKHFIGKDVPVLVTDPIVQDINSKIFT